MRTPVLVVAAAGVVVAGVVVVVAMGGKGDEGGGASASPVSAAERDRRVTPDIIPARPDRGGAEERVVEARPEAVERETAARPERGDGDENGDRRRWRRPKLGEAPMDPGRFAEEWGPRISQWNELRAEFDADGDGQLSEVEIQAMREAMRERWRERRLQQMEARFDVDGDGVLSDAERLEMEAELEARRAEWDARRAEREARLVERFDADGDGELSDEERQAARDSFRRDRGDDGDGDRRRGGRDMMREMVRRYDNDGDGTLNLDESYDAYLDRHDAMQQFEFARRYDANADGAMDAADLDSYLAEYEAKSGEADVNEDGLVNERDVELFRDLMMMPPVDVPMFGGGRGPGGGGGGGGGRGGP